MDGLKKLSVRYTVYETHLMTVTRFSYNGKTGVSLSQLQPNKRLILLTPQVDVVGMEIGLPEQVFLLIASVYVLKKLSVRRTRLIVPSVIAFSTSLYKVWKGKYQYAVGKLNALHI